MSAEYFLDTNILIYAFSSKEPEKREKAAGLISQGLAKGTASISTQVIQEFMHAALHKASTSIPLAALEDYVEHVLSPLCKVHASLVLLQQALEIHRLTQYRFYDSLVIAAALESGASVLYSEDLQDGRKIGHLTITNPFKAR